MDTCPFARIAKTNKDHATVIAYAFRVSRDFDQMFACLRYARAYAGEPAADPLFGYLERYRWAGSGEFRRDFDWFQECAHAFLGE